MTGTASYATEALALALEICEGALDTLHIRHSTRQYLLLPDGPGWARIPYEQVEAQLAAGLPLETAGGPLDLNSVAPELALLQIPRISDPIVDQVSSAHHRACWARVGLQRSPRGC